MKEPDFIGIGAQKSATTWIYKMLKQHPEISFGKQKEIDFFNDISSFYSKDYTSNYKEKDINWYLEQLKIEENKINGEISPLYLYDKKSAKRINKHFPEVKIFTVLRNPIERAFSQYIWANKTFYIGENFEDAINKHSEFTERSLYYKQLKEYYNLFHEDQIKILLFEDLKADSAKFLRELEQFLGVSNFVPENRNEKVNKSKIPKFRSINKIVSLFHEFKTTKVGSIVWNSYFFKKFKNRTKKIIKRINLAEKEKPEIDTSTKKKLSEYFQEDVRKLENLVDRDLEDVWNI